MIDGDVKGLRHVAAQLRETQLHGKSMKYAGDVLDKLIEEITSKVKPSVPPMASASPGHIPGSIPLKSK